MTSTQFGETILRESFQDPLKQPELLPPPGGNPTWTSALLGQTALVKPFTFPGKPYEYKVTALRECPTSDSLHMCDTPDRVADYWRLNVPANPYFNPECECFVVLLLNTRRRVKGHHLVSIGTLDTILVHPREVFRLAIMTAAAAIVLTHNHPSGDPLQSGLLRVPARSAGAGQELAGEGVLAWRCENVEAGGARRP